MKKALFLLLLSFQVAASDTATFVVGDSQIEEALATFTFKDSATERRAIKLAKELRCPQCENQNLLESNSPIAMDLRLVVYQEVNAGKSDHQVKDYMVARFGEFVLYKPTVSANNALLWGVPLTLLVLTVFLSLRLLKP